MSACSSMTFVVVCERVTKIAISFVQPVIRLQRKNSQSRVSDMDSSLCLHFSGLISPDDAVPEYFEVLLVWKTVDIY